MKFHPTDAECQAMDYWTEAVREYENGDIVVTNHGLLGRVARAYIGRDGLYSNVREGMLEKMEEVYPGHYGSHERNIVYEIEPMQKGREVRTRADKFELADAVRDEYTIGQTEDGRSHSTTEIRKCDPCQHCGCNMEEVGHWSNGVVSAGYTECCACGNVKQRYDP